jgi:hypothetical protein
MRVARAVKPKGGCDVGGDDIDEFITSKACSGSGWAIAYALLELGKAINVHGHNIVGVDDYNGLMRIGWALEQMVDAKEAAE